MPRITHVKKAQQRYARVPVLDENGLAKRVPVSRVTKTGRPVFKAGADQVRQTCDKCGVEIKVGDPYKWIAPKSGPYGGTRRHRCAACPNWQVWEYSYSLSARLAQIVHEGENSLADCASKDDLESAVESIADEIQSIAEEQEEKADNIEEGFGHETYISEELREQAEQLTEWADEVREALDTLDDAPEESECQECDAEGSLTRRDTCETCYGTGIFQGEHANETCPNCDGNRYVEYGEECSQCGGTGTADPTDEELDEWLEEAQGAIIDALSNCPL